MAYKDTDGNGYSNTYLRRINNRLSTIFNYAVKYYAHLFPNKRDEVAEKLQEIF